MMIPTTAIWRMKRQKTVWMIPLTILTWLMILIPARMTIPRMTVPMRHLTLAIPALLMVAEIPLSDNGGMDLWIK